MSSRSNQKQRRRQPAASGSRPASAASQSGGAPTEAAEPTAREERLAALSELQTARGSDVLLSYVTSSRPGLSAQMSLDAVRRIADHMPEQKVKRLDLFLSSDGGDSIVPWRLMTLLREYAEEVDVLVPHRAFSAATLACLGANHIVMHPMGMLGPIDPTVHDSFGPVDAETGQRPGVSVEDVAAYNDIITEDLELTTESERTRAFEVLASSVHPLTLGRVRRGSSQARMLGGKLLKLRNPEVTDAEIEIIVKALTEDLHYHGHPINRVEAEQLGLHIERPTAEVEAAMWKLYVAYEDDLEMQLQFDQIAAAAQQVGVPQVKGAPKVAKLDGVRRVVVESELRADVYDTDLEITIGRNDEGAITSSLVALDFGWSIEE